MSKVGVFLGGEGANELGSRGGAPGVRCETKPGVIESLLRLVQPEGWDVVGAQNWCRITKLRVKPRASAEEQNVLGLIHEAQRAQAPVVAFVRDGDGDKKRPKAIDAAIDRAKREFPEVEVIGTAAIPVLEGWLLALLGQHNTESLSKAGAQSRLEASGIDSKDTAAMVRAVEQADLARVPKDAESLTEWLRRAHEVLPPLIQAAAKESPKSPE